MDCEEVRRALGALADGEEASLGRAEVESHVSNCSACARAARVLEAERAYFAALPRPAAPAGLGPRVLGRISGAGGRRVSAVPFLRAVVAAASVLLVVTVGAVFLSTGPVPATPPALTAGRAVDRLMEAIVREGVPRIGAEARR